MDKKKRTRLFEDNFPMKTRREMRKYVKKIDRRWKCCLDQTVPLFDEDEMVEFYNLFTRWCTQVNHQRGFSRNLMYWFVQECYWSQFGDSAIVAGALKALHESHGQFLFLVQPTESTTPSLLRRYTNKMEIKPLQYFLEHALIHRVEFDNVRLASVEVFDIAWKSLSEVAVRRSAEDLFMLLSYGALTVEVPRTPEQKKKRKKRKVVFLKLVHQKLLKYLVMKIAKINPRFVSFQSGKFKAGQKYELEVYIDCCRWLQRIAPYRAMVRPDTEDDIEELRGKRQLTKGLVRMKEWLDAMCGIKSKAYKAFFEPMSLKHWSRIAIRRALYLSWQLPHGIEQLPISDDDKSYIMLLSG